MRNTSYAVVLGLVACALAIVPCRKFVCQNPVDRENPDVCARVEKTSPTEWTEFVGDCGSGMYCRVGVADDNAIRCADSPEYYRYPGMACEKPDLCMGKEVRNGICRGKEAGEKCDTHLECDVGLRCGLDTVCERASEENEHCDEEHLLCQSYLYCKEGLCANYGSIPDHMPPGPAREDMCQSHYVNKRGVCEAGPKLKGEIFVESNDNLCVYSDETQHNAVCGYHKDGKAICKPGEGDTFMTEQWAELLVYLRKKPQCSPYLISYMGQCDYAENFEGDDYLKGRIAYGLLHYYTQIQEVPTCIQNYVHTEYWAVKRRYNGASTLSMLLGLLVTLALFFI